jgi:hypothetical protein
VTPPSVRFLGRRVYAAVVVLAASLSALIASTVPSRTLRRWSEWWRGPFVESVFYRAARARLMPPVETAQLPSSLIERFWDGTPDKAEWALLRALAFVSPLTASASFSRDGP